jgi:hypothetical protein
MNIHCRVRTETSPGETFEKRLLFSKVSQRLKLSNQN